MTVKTFAGVLLSASKKARQAKRAKKALTSGKKLSAGTLQQYISQAGLKKPKTTKLSKKVYMKAYNKEYNKGYKSLSKYQHRAGQTKLKDITRQQKATTHSGIEIKTQKGTHYGIRGRTMKVNPGGFGAIVKRMPYVGSRETWGEEMSRMYGGVHMSQNPESIKKSIQILIGKKKRKIKKKLKGGLLTKAIKRGFKQFKKETVGHPMHKRSRLKLKQDTKYIKTPELSSLGVHKIKPDDLRKLTIAQGLKIKVQKQAKTSLNHHRKAMKLLWGKAKNLNQVFKLNRYNKPRTEKKLDKFHKDYTNLETYINKIKSKSATKHSIGGEIVIGKNVDTSLL